MRAVFNGHLHWNHLDVIAGIPYVTVQSLIENLDDDAPGRAAAAHAVVHAERPAHGGARPRQRSGAVPVRVVIVRSDRARAPCASSGPAGTRRHPTPASLGGLCHARCPRPPLASRRAASAVGVRVRARAPTAPRRRPTPAPVAAPTPSVRRRPFRATPAPSSSAAGPSARSSRRPTRGSRSSTATTTLALVNRSPTGALPPAYAPSDLVDLRDGHAAHGRRVRLGARVPPPRRRHGPQGPCSREMRAAKMPGHVVSSFRGFGTQCWVFANWAHKARGGFCEATEQSALPGHSQHQLGTTVDLFTNEWAEHGARTGEGVFRNGFGCTTGGEWLDDNAWRFGFVAAVPHPPRRPQRRLAVRGAPRSAGADRPEDRLQERALAPALHRRRRGGALPRRVARERSGDARRDHARAVAAGASAASWATPSSPCATAASAAPARRSRTTTPQTPCGKESLRLDGTGRVVAPGRAAAPGRCEGHASGRPTARSGST